MMAVAVVTQLRGDMKLVPPYTSAEKMACPQGRSLVWWEYEPENRTQWFRTPESPTLCGRCWAAAGCPQHFGYPSAHHETLLGLLPLGSGTMELSMAMSSATSGYPPASSERRYQSSSG
jgi:hypothetical protein